MISIMEILLLMMLLHCQQNCRLPHGPHHTNHLSSPCMMAFRSEAVSDELRSNHIFIWRQYRSHGEIFHHGSQECCANLVFLSSARNNHFMAEAEGHVTDQLSRISNEASYSSSPLPVYSRSRRIPSGVCPKVLTIEGAGTNGAQ